MKITRPLKAEDAKKAERGEKGKKRLSNNGGNRSCFILYIDPLVSSKRLTMNKLVSRKLLRWSVMSTSGVLYR